MVGQHTMVEMLTMRHVHVGIHHIRTNRASIEASQCSKSDRGATDSAVVTADDMLTPVALPSFTSTLTAQRYLKKHVTVMRE